MKCTHNYFYGYEYDDDDEDSINRFYFVEAYRGSSQEGTVYPVYRNFKKLKVINLTSFCKTRITDKKI